MNQLLQNAIDNKQVKEYYGSLLIYPKRFLNSMVLNALLISLKNDYDFFNIMGTIKAMPKRQEGNI